LLPVGDQIAGLEIGELPGVSHLVGHRHPGHEALDVLVLDAGFHVSRDLTKSSELIAESWKPIAES
jgi:hypothetical protein